MHIPSIKLLSLLYVLVPVQDDFFLCCAKIIITTMATMATTTIDKAMADTSPILSPDAGSETTMVLGVVGVENSDTAVSMGDLVVWSSGMGVAPVGVVIRRSDK